MCRAKDVRRNILPGLMARRPRHINPDLYIIITNENNGGDDDDDDSISSMYLV